jgi:hypothetical protein
MPFIRAKMGETMGEGFKVQRKPFSINLAFVLVLSLTIVSAAIAQTSPKTEIPEKAPPRWNAEQQQFWKSERDACVELNKETAKYRAMTPEQRAKLPNVSKPQAREQFERWKDCARMVPPRFPNLSNSAAPPKDKGMIPTPLPTPTPLS